MQILKQSTATTVYVGPVLDASGAAVTTAVLGDFRLVKNGTAATLTGATVAHDANGYYTIALTATNTDTTGRLTLAVGNTAQSMATHRFTVLLASVFDAIVTNATNTTGGLATATAAITALSGAVSTYAGGDTAGTTTLLGRLQSAISLNAGAVTVGTNNDKNGYNITQAFPTNFSAMAITVGGAVTAGTVSDKSGYSLTPTTGLGNQTANITGSLSGSVGSVTNRVTANTDQWGGVVVTGMPMPTYIQPAGFLGATFPAILASTTNITGATGIVLAPGTHTGARIPFVTLVDTTTVNTDMRGTNNALLAADYVAPLTTAGTAAAVWNALLATYTTSGSFGARVMRLDAASSGNAAKVTGAGHVAADIHELQPGVITAADFSANWLTADGTAADYIAELQAAIGTAANQAIVLDRTAYALTVLAGACSDAQTAAETYTLTIGGNTFTVDYSGLDTSGNRGATTLSKV